MTITPDRQKQVAMIPYFMAGQAFLVKKGNPQGFKTLDDLCGKNIGAELQTDQAEADKRSAQAKAEERRALAVAVEQEFKAEAQNQRSKVIAAEAQIPLAIALCAIVLDALLSDRRRSS